MYRSLSHVILVCVVALLLVPSCGGPGSVLPDVYQNPKKPAQQAETQACKANLRAIYAMEQAYHAQNGRYATLEELASQGSVPPEPSGGSYSIDTRTGLVTCSVGHGHYPE